MRNELKTSTMHELVRENITLYYEQEKQAAHAVLCAVEADLNRIAAQLTITTHPRVHLFVYDELPTLHEKYEVLYGRKPAEWVVGTCEGNIILLVSPANPGEEHDFDSLVKVALHEMVHIYNQQLNASMFMWIDEGLASFLSKQNPEEYGYVIEYHPTFEEMQTNDSSIFADAEGYALSYFYIAHLFDVFGWDAVLTLAKTNDCMMAFSRSAQDVYADWIQSLFAKGSFGT